MRIAAFAIVLCLLVSPAAHAGNQVVVVIEASSFLKELWDALVAIPTTISKATDGTDTTTTTSGANTPIEPPEGDAGPMVIVNG